MGQFIVQYSHRSTQRVTLMLISYMRYKGIVTKMRIIQFVKAQPFRHL